MAHPAISRGVCTAQCGFFIYIDVGHEAPPCRALRAPAGREERKKENRHDNPREGWEDGTPPPHRDFKERGVVR